MLEDLKIRPEYDGFVYLADTRSLPRLRPHRHVELELNLVERGTITYVVDGRRFRFTQRTLLWMYPNQEHQLVDRTDDARYYVAVFKPHMIEQACSSNVYAELKRRSVRTSEHGVLHAELAPDAFETASRAMDSFMQEGPDPDVLNREAGFGAASDFHYVHRDADWLNAGLRYLLLLVWRLQMGQTGTSRAVALHPAVRKALALLSDESQEPMDLRRIAQRCGVSVAYLSRTFARQVGSPLSRYRTSLRLRRFWEVMREPSQPSVTQAAYAAGFGSYAQFYKVFTATYGSGPRARLRRG